MKQKKQFVKPRISLMAMHAQNILTGSESGTSATPSKAATEEINNTTFNW